MVHSSLKPLEQELSSIIQGLKSLQAKGVGVKEEEVNSFQDRLRKLENEHVRDGVWYARGDKEVAEGQGALADMLAEGHELVSDLLETASE